MHRKHSNNLMKYLLTIVVGVFYIMAMILAETS
jgi:hypothetical protein